MALQDIIDYCVSQTLTAPGVGIVRGYEDLITSHDQIEADAIAAGVINYVEIVRESTPSIYFANARNQRDHNINFHFYTGLNTPSISRPAHVALVEAVVEVFRNDFRLGGTAVKAEPLAITFDGHIEKFGATLHYALGVLMAREDLED